MATYNIKYKLNNVYVEQTPNKFDWNRVANFFVVELNYSDTISLPVKTYTAALAKAAVKAKIIAYLAKQTYDAEYTETIP